MRLIDADELINQGYEIVVGGLQYNTCNKSIDINNIPTAHSVDNGGVYDDVCEWEYDKHFEFAKSKCGSIDTHRIEFKKLKYCPYCGKKIKVVE